MQLTVYCQPYATLCIFPILYVPKVQIHFPKILNFPIVNRAYAFFNTCITFSDLKIVCSFPFLNLLHTQPLFLESLDTGYGSDSQELDDELTIKQASSLKTPEPKGTVVAKILKIWSTEKESETTPGIFLFSVPPT